MRFIKDFVVDDAYGMFCAAVPLDSRWQVLSTERILF